MKKQKPYLLMSILFLFPSLSYGGFGIQAGINSYKPIFSGPAYYGANTEHKESWIGRIYATSSPPALPIMLEGGASLAERKYKFYNAAGSEEIAYRAIGFDALLRLGWKFFNVGVGGAFMVFMPNADVTPTGQASVVRSMAAKGLKYSDYGILGSGRMGLPLGLIALTAELRYFHGLANISNSLTSEGKSREASLLLGIDF